MLRYKSEGSLSPRQVIQRRQEAKRRVRSPKTFSPPPQSELTPDPGVKSAGLVPLFSSTPPELEASGQHSWQGSLQPGEPRSSIRSPFYIFTTELMKLIRALPPTSKALWWDRSKSPIQESQPVFSTCFLRGAVSAPLLWGLHQGLLLETLKALKSKSLGWMLAPLMEREMWADDHSRVDTDWTLPDREDVQQISARLCLSPSSRGRGRDGVLLCAPCATFITPNLFAPYLLTLTLRVMPSLLILSPSPSFSTPHPTLHCFAGICLSAWVKQFPIASEFTASRQMSGEKFTAPHPWPTPPHVFPWHQAELLLFSRSVVSDSLQPYGL